MLHRAFSTGTERPGVGLYRNAILLQSRAPPDVARRRCAVRQAVFTAQHNVLCGFALLQPLAAGFFLSAWLCFCFATLIADRLSLTSIVGPYLRSILIALFALLSLFHFFCLSLVPSTMASLSQGKVIKRADPSTIHDKFLVGYQGWFTCAGDGQPVGPGHHGWLHWFNYPVPDGGRPNTDLWPDVSEYTPSELFPAPGVKYADGTQAFLFSSRHPKTVQRHFNWMAQHGVDGAFLQRFLGQTDLEQGNEGIRNQRDEVGDRVMEAAEKEGRVFAIMYDVSGVAPDRIQRVLEHDWIHLIRRKAILDSPAYLREQGRPVVALWGFGMSDAHHSPAMVRAVARFIRDNTPGGAYIMAGVPAHWRTSVMDADPDPEFVRVWLDEFDAISPWTIGRYSDEEGADKFEQEKIKGDAELIKQHNERWEHNRGTMRRVDYIPVVFPGGSGHNLSEGKWGWNDCPRKGGHFMWRQLFNVRRHGVRTIYGAMWDEYDEGTAFLPVVSHRRQLPVLETHRFMALDEDGFDLPPDWYMRICGFAAEGLRGERMISDTFPSKELQDYWATRPRYEDIAGAGPSGPSGSGDGDKSQTWEQWEKLTAEKGDTDEPPPPPYSLEAEEPQTRAAPSGAGAGAPPPVPLERRPTLPGASEGPPPPPLASRPAPPVVRSGSRPSSQATSPSFSQSTFAAQDVPVLENFNNLSVSSPPFPSSPSADHASYSHHSHSPSPRPVSPAHSHHSHHSHTSSHSASAPAPGFSPNLFPTPPPSSGPGGPWTQAAWPPPEWGLPQPQPPAAPYHPGAYSQNEPPFAAPHRPGYSPGYAAEYPPSAGSPPPAPPLGPRPSQSHHHHHSPPPPSPAQAHAPHAPHARYGADEPPYSNGGGFAFPEAHVSSPGGTEFCGVPPVHSPYGPPPMSSYASNGPPQAPAFPSGPGGFPAPAGPPPPPQRPYGSAGSIAHDYYNPGALGGPSNPAQQQHQQHAAHHQSQGHEHDHNSAYNPQQHQHQHQYQPPPGPPPAPTYARPPTHPASGYSGSYGQGQGQSQAPPPAALSSGPLGQAFNLVGNVAGQGAKTQLQNLASSGSKLFSKYRK
ncbi:hypothetical protein C8Q79DRAFT_933198 [Trametes meyenii]|nr:hypothetical protein C8Q79DRAFT_933198 [Trametes meyenii]